MQASENELISFVEWVADNGYVFDGVSLWKKKFYGGTQHQKEILFRTRELVQKFRRDGPQGGTTEGGQTSLAKL